MAEELLKLENIYKNFGNVKVLKDVNIKINKGEVVALIGDNGAGKSTLIKVITGVHSPNSGKVFFKEKEVQIKSVAQSRKMGIEAVYQERALHEAPVRKLMLRHVHGELASRLQQARSHPFPRCRARRC